MCYVFDGYLVAGFTPVLIGGPHDIPVDRPGGMEGYIMNITVRGKAWVELPDSSQVLCEKNDVMLFPPGVRHHYWRDESSECWDHFWIYFIPRPYWLDWLKWQGSADGIGKMSITDAQGEMLKSLFTETISHFSAGNTLSESMAMNVLEKIILTCFSMQDNVLLKDQDVRIKEVCRYIDTHISDDISISKLASLVCLSSSRLSHLFRQETGQTINEWKESQRVYRARNMLQNTALSVSDIARMTGYNDAFYFSKVFRKHCGISPRGFRNNYCKLVSFK